MVMKRPAVYWDSCVFLYRLQQDPEKINAINEVYQAAEAGSLLIVTSVVTVTEVLYYVDQDGGKHDLSVGFERSLRKSFFVVPNLDRATARRAAELRGLYGLTSRDSIHLATCERQGVRELHSYDGSGKKPRHGQLLPLDGQLEVQDGPLRIKTPRLPPGVSLPAASGPKLFEGQLPGE